MRLLLVEDTEDVAEAILDHLRQRGHVCDLACTVEDANHFSDHESYDLVILDLNLPDGSGLDFLRRLRSRKNEVPVLILTARMQVHDKIDALDFGADDYLVKPFDLRELEARARAITRRRHGASEAIMRVGNLACNFAAQTVLIDEAEVELTRREFILLEIFMSNLNRVMEKNQLYSRLFGLQGEAQINAVEVYIARLRRKLACSDLEIKTLRGLGYQASLKPKDDRS